VFFRPWESGSTTSDSRATATGLFDALR